MKTEIAVELIDLFVPAQQRTDALKWLTVNQNRGWGGKRQGTGAPRGNKNHAKKFNQDNQDSILIESKTQSVATTKNKIVVKEQDLSQVAFSAGFQNWSFPKVLLVEAKKYWTAATIRKIEVDFSCQEYETVTTIAKLLEEYPADSCDATLDIAFTTFWDIFPKQRAGSKEKAKKKFIAIVKNKKATIDELLNGARAYKISDEVARGFAKGCVAWLNDDRWTVNYQPAQQIKNLAEANKLNEWANQ